MDELISEAITLIELIGTTGCGCDDSNTYRKAQAWLERAAAQNTSTNSAIEPCYFCGRIDGTHERGRSCNRDVEADNNFWK